MSKVTNLEEARAVIESMEHYQTDLEAQLAESRREVNNIENKRQSLYAQLKQAEGNAKFRLDAMNRCKAEYEAQLAQAEAEKRVWADRAEKLWQILDDIDTLYDVYKSNHDGLVIAIDKRHKKRFEIAESDGYNLTWTKAKESNDE